MAKRKASQFNDTNDLMQTDYEPPTKRARLINNDTDRRSNSEHDVKFKRLSFGIDWFSASDKGKKPHMEDRRIAISDLSSKFKHKFTAQNNCRLFGIIDGHGGSSVSSYCQTHLPLMFIENLKRYVISNTEDSSAMSQSNSNNVQEQQQAEQKEVGEEKKTESESKEARMTNNVQRALHATFKQCDEKLLKMIGPMKSEGATTTLVYFQNDVVFTANIGDSKAVLARVSKETAHETHYEDQKLQALLITQDHTVLQLSEVKRIESCNGHIVNGRVNGVLEVTRSFGDPEMKKIGVLAAPNISKFKVCKRDKFMIIGCDGLWSVFSLSDAVEFVEERLNHISKPSVEEVTRQLLADAILNKQAKDNVSAIIIRFHHA